MTNFRYQGSVKETFIDVPDGFDNTKTVHVYFGKILDIPGDILYEAGTLADLKEDFKWEVDKYVGKWEWFSRVFLVPFSLHHHYYRKNV